MIPVDLKLTNFKSYKSEYIKFPEGDLCLFDGDNGSGKSSIWEAIYFALFRYVFRPSLDDVIMRGEKFTKVEFGFKMPGSDLYYKVITSREREGSTKMEFFIDGEPQDKGKLSETQNLIEDIIKTNRELFLKTNWIKQRDIDAYEKMTHKERKEILVNVLSISIFKKWEKSAKEKLKKLRSKFNNIEIELCNKQKLINEEDGYLEEKEQTEEVISRLEDYLKNYNEKLDKAVADYNRLKGYKDKIIELKSDKKEMTDELDSVKETLRDLKLKGNQLKSLIKNIDVYEEKNEELKSLREEKEQLSNKRTEYHIWETNKNNLERAISLAKERKEKLAELKIEMENVKEEEKWTTLNEKILDLKYDKMSLEEDLEKLIKSKMNPVCPNCGSKVDLEEIEDKIEKAENNIRTLDEEIDRLVIERDKFQKPGENNIKFLKSSIEKMTDELKEILGKFSIKLSELVEYYKEHTAKDLKPVEDEIESVSDKIEELSEYEDLLNSAKNAKEKIQLIKESYNLNKERYKALKSKIAKTHDEILKLSEYEDEFEIVKDRVEDLKDRLKLTQSDVNKANKDLGEVEGNLKRIQEYKKEVEEIREEFEQLNKDIKEYEILENEVYHINALPAHLIKKSIPALQDRINAVLQILSDGLMELRIITEMENKSNDNIRDVFDYEINDGTGWDTLDAFSGGEATRINMAIRLGMNQLASDLQGTSNNILIIDEGMSQLDSSGKKEFALMMTKLRDYFHRIFIMTHDKEFKTILDDVPKIKFKKTIDGSKVEIQE